MATARALARWAELRDEASATRAARAALQRVGASLQHPQLCAALRSWASWRAARGAARAVAAHALQRLLRAREARALAAWREAAVEAGARRRVVRGAVRRVQHAARARALQRWAGRHRLARAFVGLHRRHALRRAVTRWRAALRTPSVHRLLSVARLRARHAPSPTLTAFWRCDPPHRPQPALAGQLTRTLVPAHRRPLSPAPSRPSLPNRRVST